MDPIIYLDHAATTPVDPAVRKAMDPWFAQDFGNPTTLYAHGVRADEAVEGARQTIAHAIGAQRPQEVYFTAGGTESINWALKGIALERVRGHILTSAIEHSAVRETCLWLAERGFELTILPVAHDGVVDPAEVRRALRSDTILVTLMHANNEIGTIEPIEEVGSVLTDSEAAFHVDAVQTVAHLPIDVQQLRCDLLSASGHKLYGPKGTGFLYARSGIRLGPLLHGGGQERELRSGTHNVPGIIGLAKALEVSTRLLETETQQLTALSRRLIDGILERIPGATLNGSTERRLPSNVHFTFENTQGEALVLGLDLAGICVSTGSACSTVSLEPSHVLKAIGLSDEQALASVRFTLGRSTTEEQIDAVLEVLPEEVNRLRAMSPRAL